MRLKKIKENAPIGATHYDKGFERYMKRDSNDNLTAYINGEWKQIRFYSGSKHSVISLL